MTTNDNNFDDESPWKRKKKTSNNDAQSNIEAEIYNFFNSQRGKNNTPPGGGEPYPKQLFTMLAIAIIGIWLSSGLYVVDEGEQAVVLRFGEFVRVSTPGLNYHIPSPIEKIIKHKVEMVERVEVGFRSTGNRDVEGGLNQRDIAEESLMLTGDENIVDINFVVQWKVRDIKDFMFNVHNPKQTVKSAAESAMREVIGNTPFAAAQTEARSNVEKAALLLLQNILDYYGSGIDIVNLQMLKIDPPEEVIDAFRDVQTARADKEREINQGLSYHNDIIPKARGEAAKILQEAEGYKQEVVALSEGAVSRFNAVYEQYKGSKEVTKRRIYIETMEDVLKGMNKVIIDKSAGQSIVPYLPLPQIDKKQ
jgi:membrane protease subunit HflK